MKPIKVPGRGMLNTMDCMCIAVDDVTRDVLVLANALYIDSEDFIKASVFSDETICKYGKYNIQEYFLFEKATLQRNVFYIFNSIDLYIFIMIL